MKNLGAGFIFIYNDRILLLKKANKNIWDIPGGHKDKKENYFEAAKRETLEEIGVLPVFRKIGYFLKEDKDNKYKVFYATVNQPFRCYLSDEHVDYDWFNISQLPHKIHKKISGAIDYLVDSIDKQKKNIN